MSAVTTVVLVMLALAGVINVIRMVRAGSIVDRALGADGVAAVVICGLAVSAVHDGDGVLIDIALVGGLLGFLTLAAVARYVARRSA